MLRDRSSPRARAEQRRGLRRRVAFRCRIHDGAVERHTRVLDIGPGGVRVATAVPPPVGLRLELDLELVPGPRRVSTPARVVWRADGPNGRGGQMGLAFDDPQAVATLALDG